MYYEEESRRFNLVSGLLSGAVLGAGIALLLLPERGSVRRIRRVARGAGHSASRRVMELGGDFGEVLAGAVMEGRRRSRP